MTISSSTPIKAWSMSRLDVFESCPYRAKLQYIDKVPQPELVPPPGKDEHPLHRGLRVHDAGEAYVTRDVNLIPELEYFRDDFDHARARFREKPGCCVVEEEWAFTQDWDKTGWNSDNAWGRLKLDLGLRSDCGKSMRVVDYKTGKKYPAKHVQQGQLYALVSFLRYPELEKVTTEFWYLDQPCKTREKNYLKNEYSRIKAMILKDSFHDRATAMTTATTFPPKTSSFTCRWCPYGANGNEACDYRFEYDN